MKKGTPEYYDFIHNLYLDGLTDEQITVALNQRGMKVSDQYMARYWLRRGGRPELRPVEISRITPKPLHYGPSILVKRDLVEDCVAVAVSRYRTATPAVRRKLENDLDDYMLQQGLTEVSRGGPGLIDRQARKVMVNWDSRVKRYIHIVTTLGVPTHLVDEAAEVARLEAMEAAA